MAQSKAADVGAYIAEASPERAPYLERLRAACLAELPNLSEEMRYGMATYVRDGEPLVAFANQKGYISLYLTQEVFERHAEALAGLDHGKACLRFRRPERIDFALVERLLRDAQASDRPPC